MKTTAIAIVLAFIVTAVAAGMIYPATMEIIQLDTDEDIVYLETATGFVFAMYGCEDYAAGDLVSLIMWSNGTPAIMDDEILSARYAGWNLG